MTKDETKPEENPEKRIGESPTPVKAIISKIEPDRNTGDIIATLQSISQKIEAFESTVGQLQHKVTSVETQTGSVQQEVLKGLNTIKGSVSEHLQSVATKLQEQITALEKTFQHQQSNLDEKLRTSFENQQSTIDDHLKRSFAIERKMEEERLKTFDSHRRIMGKSEKPNQRRMPWYFGFLENPAHATQGSREMKRKVPQVTFDTVERQIRSKICTGKKAISSIKRLSDSLKLGEDRRYEDIARILKIIIDRLGMEEVQTLTENNRNFVLNELDRAEIAYHALKRHYKPISKSQVRKILDRLLRRLTTAPYAAVLKDKIEYFREILQDSNYALDDHFFKEIRNTEKELLALGDYRLDNLTITKYETLIQDWKKQIEKLLPETTLMILEPMLNWLQEIIKILSEDPAAEVENEAYHLFFLFRQKEKEIMKYATNEDLYAQVKAFKKELEAKIYERVSFKDAQRYMSLLLSWKKVILQALSEEKI